MAAAQKRSPSLVLFLNGFVGLWLMIAAGPFLWTLWGSFKVEGDFFSKADWTYALYGIRTLAETGGVFTGNGYHG
ncbi:MAG: carbohydrate ABC transporter permease, partial [Paracoccaceae bacterium]|nr:carbohydrate ABC transporter permease [Paracoccaceae bacterium]